MLVGISLTGRSSAETVHAARLADRAGIDILKVGDAQNEHRDAFCLLTACALATERILLGPLVVNPSTRHATALACAIATIDEMSAGRAFLGIGRGNAAVKSAGLPRATPSALRDALRTIEETLGRASSEPMRARPIAWARRKVPILVAATGPLMRDLAVETADGATFLWGDLDPAHLAEQTGALRAARAKGPRAGEPFQIWSIVNACISDSAARVRRTMDLSKRAYHLPEREWPAELADRFRRYHELFQHEHYASKTNRVNRGLMEELGLTDFIVDRYALVGDVAAVARRIRDAARSGLDALILVPIEDAQDDEATRVGKIADVRRAALSMLGEAAAEKV